MVRNPTSDVGQSLQEASHLSVVSDTGVVRAFCRRPAHMSDDFEDFDVGCAGLDQC